MKFWLVFGAMVLLSPIPGLSGESTDYLITNSSLGRIRLEMTKHEVSAAYPRLVVESVDLFLEGMSALALQVKETGRVIITAELDGERVYRLTTSDARFKTREGIGVGATLAEAQRHYGKYELLSGDDGLFAVFAMGKGVLSCRVDLDQPASVSPDTKILNIIDREAARNEAIKQPTLISRRLVAARAFRMSVNAANEAVARVLTVDSCR